MFMLGAGLAAVFELSVCAGLITVVFVAVISMTVPASPKEQETGESNHYARYVPMVFLVLLVGWATGSTFSAETLPAYRILSGPDVRQVLWNLRQTDILGQSAVMFAGIYGVIILFKGLKHDE